MSELLELQRRMASAVMQPLTRDDRMRQRTKHGKSARAEAEAFIKPNDKLSSFERLEIYNRQYWFRVLSCFAEDFPGLRAVVGARKFERLMRAYLVDCPSISFTLRNLGSRLEEWLQDHQQFAAPLEQLALDMVRIEWAHVEAFDGSSGPPLTPADIETGGDDLTLSLQPHIQLLELNHAVDDLLIEIRSKTTTENTSSNNARERPKQIRIEHYARPQTKRIYLAVHRLDNSVYYKRLETEEFRILRGIRERLPLEYAFNKAFETTTLSLEERVELIQTWFKIWSQLGWFCRSISRA